MPTFFQEDNNMENAQWFPSGDVIPNRADYQKIMDGMHIAGQELEIFLGKSFFEIPDNLGHLSPVAKDDLLKEGKDYADKMSSNMDELTGRAYRAKFIHDLCVKLQS